MENQSRSLFRPLIFFNLLVLPQSCCSDGPQTPLLTARAVDDIIVLLDGDTSLVAKEDGTTPGFLHSMQSLPSWE